MPTSLAVMDSVHRSNLHPSEKSAIRRFYEKLAPRANSLIVGAEQKLGLSRSTAIAGAHALRAGGEALLVGAGLGALDAQLSKDPSKSGLDVNVPIGSGYNAPIDGLLGAAGFVASMVPSLAAVSEDAKTVGIIGTASWSQRQAKAWVQNRAATPATGGAPASGAHGEFGSDEILQWAANQS